MIVHLMLNPWAASAAHVIAADTPREWRAAIAGLPPARYSAAIETDAGIFPVQRFNGATWPADVISSDGFLVIRTGIGGAKLADRQWQCLSEFPGHLAAAGKFTGEISDMTRRAVFPPPKLVED